MPACTATAFFSRMIIQMNTSKHSPGDDAHCLAAVMRASPCEIYLIDAATLRLVDANAAACANLQYDLPRLRSMTLQQVAPQLSRDQLDAALTGATGDIGELDTLQRRSDGSLYRLTLRLTHSLRDDRALIVAVSKDQGYADAPQEDPGKVKEQERTRIAREIHDDLGGNLTAIKMALAMLSQRLPPENPQLQQRAAYVDALVERSIEAMHRIVLDLRPPVLDFGIVAALEWQIKEFEMQTGVRCALQSNQADVELDLDQSSALFRIFQEALTNIAKHAEASRVTVRLARTRHHVSLKIADNGRGMAACDRAKPTSFGICGMMERAKALGGSVTLAAVAGGGTMVSIKIASSAPAATKHDVSAEKNSMNRRYP